MFVVRAKCMSSFEVLKTDNVSTFTCKCLHCWLSCVSVLVPAWWCSCNSAEGCLTNSDTVVSHSCCVVPCEIVQWHWNEIKDEALYYKSNFVLNCLTASVQKSRTDVIGITSDEDSVNDNGSVISVVSETKSIIEEGELFSFSFSLIFPLLRNIVCHWKNVEQCLSCLVWIMRCYFQKGLHCSTCNPHRFFFFFVNSG